MTAKTSDTKTTQGDGVDYEQAKEQFMLLVKHWLNSQRNRRHYDLHSKDYIEKVVKKQTKTEGFRSKVEMIKKDGKDVLVMKRKYRFDPYIQVLTWDEMFDMFMPLHVQSGHKGREYLMNKVGNNYKYPSMCLTFFKRICNVCNRAAGRYSLIVASRTSLVFIISMVQIRIDEQFHYLLIYSDKATNFIVLRPLKAKTEVEISEVLFQIFCQFGPPRRLWLHGYNANLTQKVNEHIKELCPEFNIIIEHKSVSYNLPTLVTDKIEEWMDLNNSAYWEVGCFMVQREMNSDPKMMPFHHDVNSTPHSLFYHTPVSSTISKQPKKNVKKTQVQKDAAWERNEITEQSLLKTKIASSTGIVNAPESDDDGDSPIDEESQDKYESENEMDEDSQDFVTVESIKSEPTAESIQDEVSIGEFEVKEEVELGWTFEEDVEDTDSTLAQKESNFHIEEIEMIKEEIDEADAELIVGDP